jgi:hypothetical protein
VEHDHGHQRHHALTAVARDAAGNTATSSSVTITVSNGSLVAAYHFDENGGGTLHDVSGNGNDGTLSGPLWTAAGKNGGALLFDGTNDLVTIADAPSLNLTSGATLEAWVKPTTVTDWRTVIAKENGSGSLAYALSANDAQNNASRERPTARLRIGGTTRTITGSARLPVNTWTHLAVTYDGARMRFYVNGVEVSNQSRSGPIATSASLLRIGGAPGLGAEFFAGFIDDVRIYSRALTASDIQRT